MRRWGVVVSLLCVAAGVIALSALPRIRSSQTQSFLQQEAYFRYPVPLRSSIASVRRDSMGKGFFGASRDGGRTHEGVDLSVDLRMPIYAAKSGRVAFAGLEKGYGKYVELSHPDGHATRYAHLSEICVMKGGWVSLGQVLGVSGKTGNARSRRIHPHLHFEIREQDRPVNPGNGLMDPAIQMR
jgi:murein DD-endopeptidase MepM/ murein hydrolase activator NlpD